MYVGWANKSNNLLVKVHVFIRITLFEDDISVINFKVLLNNFFSLHVTMHKADRPVKGMGITISVREFVHEKFIIGNQQEDDLYLYTCSFFIVSLGVFVIKDETEE